MLPNWCIGVVPWYWCSGEAAFLLHLLSSFYEAAFISLGAMALYNYTVFLYEAAYLCSMGMVLRKQRECFHLHQNSLFSFLFRFSFHTKTTIVRSGSLFSVGALPWCYGYGEADYSFTVSIFSLVFCSLLLLCFLGTRKTRFCPRKRNEVLFLFLGFTFVKIWFIFMPFLCPFFSIFYFPKITILKFLFLCNVDA